MHTPPLAPAPPLPLALDVHLSPPTFHNLLHAAPFFPAYHPPLPPASPPPITPLSPPSLPLANGPGEVQGDTALRSTSQHSVCLGLASAPSVDLDNLDAILHLPFYQELPPFTNRHLGDFEWVAFEEVLSNWTAVVQSTVSAQRHNAANPSAGWRQRQRRCNSSEACPAPPDTSPDTHQSSQGATGGRTSGHAKRAAKSSFLQRLYRVNPGACIRRLVDDKPSVYCTINEEGITSHFASTYAAAPRLAPPPPWVFKTRASSSTEGDVLNEAFTPDEEVCPWY